MSISNHAVITAEPGGTKPRFKFFPNSETAYEHARMIYRDLNRDAYVVIVTDRFYASRDSWAAKNKE